MTSGKQSLVGSMRSAGVLVEAWLEHRKEVWVPVVRMSFDK